MSRLRVLPIVEGQGDDAAVRILLQRVWRQLLGGEYIEVLRPIRWPRSKLVRESELRRAVDLAVRRLRAAASTDASMVLILLDADEDAPCVLGPQLLTYARQARPDADLACVLAKIEYETWFVAASESLDEYLDRSTDEQIPPDPEGLRLGKGWIDRRFRGTRYSPTVDQPRLTAKMDLSLCRGRSPSFDKLCRELERRLADPVG